MLKKGDIVVFRPPMRYHDEWLNGRQFVPPGERGIVESTDLFEGNTIFRIRVNFPFLKDSHMPYWFAKEWFELEGRVEE